MTRRRCRRLLNATTPPCKQRKHATGLLLLARARPLGLDPTYWCCDGIAVQTHAVHENTYYSVGTRLQGPNIATCRGCNEKAVLSDAGMGMPPLITIEVQWQIRLFRNLLCLAHLVHTVAN